MEAPLVSVVIPVYNMQDFLHETLGSVLDSDYSNLEVVVMDDGSSDKSVEIAKEIASKDARVKVYCQPNAGPCVARNHAVSLASGVYILPVDADDRIGRTFVGSAVRVLEENPDVKVVYPRAEFFGERTGEWKLPEFSLKRLAHRNMIVACAMYRKSDWERVGGYSEEVIAREDWEFWISMLKDGGKVVRLPQVGLYYRIRKNSKRIQDRSLKLHVIRVLNIRHAEFFHKMLGGPLRRSRSWSRCINLIDRFVHPRSVVVSVPYASMKPFVEVLPVVFQHRGAVLYKGRNELREFEVDGMTLVVKSFKVPHLVNRFVYRFFRASKAKRSYRYAGMLRKIGVGTPVPVGYCSTGSWLLLGNSYFVSEKSECIYTYRDFATRRFERQDDILRAIAATTAILHEHGILHKDYSAGNILFGENADGTIRVEIVDLNRMRFGKVDMETGCRNFERLPGTPEMFETMADEYARRRGYDKEMCLKLIERCHRR